MVCMAVHGGTVDGAWRWELSALKGGNGLPESGGNIPGYPAPPRFLLTLSSCLSQLPMPYQQPPHSCSTPPRHPLDRLPGHIHSQFRELVRTARSCVLRGTGGYDRWCLQIGYRSTPPTYAPSAATGCRHRCRCSPASESRPQHATNGIKSRVSAPSSKADSEGLQVCRKQQGKSCRN